jgi:hypothetical protein
MYLDTKNYLLHTYQILLKKETFIFFVSNPRSGKKALSLLEDTSSKQLTHINYVKDKLFTKTLCRSVYYYYRYLIIGLISIAHTFDKDFNFNTFQHLLKKLDVLAIKFENKIYFLEQFKKILFLNYSLNLKYCLYSLIRLSKNLSVNISKKIKLSK